MMDFFQIRLVLLAACISKSECFLNANGISCSMHQTSFSRHYRRKRQRYNSSSSPRVLNDCIVLNRSSSRNAVNEENDESTLLQEALARQASSSDSPWFQNRESLPFSCTSCGKCCKVKGDVYLSPLETLAVANYLNLSLYEFKHEFISQEEIQSGWTLLKNVGERCIFLNDSNMCTIYPARPLQCVTYPFWPRIMATPQSWNDEVVTPPANSALDDDEASRNVTVSKRWTYEDGGCEGMKVMDSIEAEMIQGVSIQNAQAMLDLYSRYDRTFPIGKPFQYIHRGD